MCHIGNGRTATEEQAIIALVEEAVEAKMRAREAFTALDVSNTLKAQNYPVRHREVSVVVRDIYDSGAMEHYDYDRRLIDVVTEGGQTRAQAWLYLHEEHKERDYTDRDQDALAPIADDQARSLDDVTAAGDPTSPLIATARINAAAARMNGTAVRMARGQRSGRRQSGTRRDGALAIPKRLVAQAGWQVGDRLTLCFDAGSSRLLLAADGATVTATATTTATVMVWADLRVRVAKTKLRRCGSSLTGNFAVAANLPQFAVDADGRLQIGG